MAWTIKPKWREGSRSLLRNLLILHLTVLAGCSNTAHKIEHAKPVEHPASPSVTHSIKRPVADAGNKYQLPELTSAVQQVDEPQASTKDSDLFDRGGELASEQKIADPRNKGYQDATDFQSMAAGMLSTAASDSVKQWFSAKHATAELVISAGERGVKSGSFDLLMPIYDAEKDLVFTQLGFRRSNLHTEDYRNTLNFGLGYRRTLDKWLVGGNVFYDRDLTGKNNRLGIGAEAWTDFLKISANGYMRLSTWKKSPDLQDYLERPANGYDFRVEANLPSYPQLGGKVVYEKYYGEQVGLFGSSNRQKDPQAVTVGVTYNPVPMIGLGVDYRKGEGGLAETTARVSVNYQFGVPLEQQLSLAYRVNHRLENTRYNLVSRNNEVTLEYREREAGRVVLPEVVHGSPGSVVSFPVTYTDATIRNFTWSGSAARYAYQYGGGPSGTLFLPAYNTSGVNTYTLQVTGTDRLGRAIQSNLMQVHVDALQITLDRSAATAMANGADAVTFTATLLEPNGEAKQNSPVTWSIQGSATVLSQDVKTDAKGNARLKLASKSASAVRVSVQEPQGAKAENSAAFTGDLNTARVVSLVASPATIAANGKSTTTLTAHIEDANGNAVGAGAPITWGTTLGVLSGTSSVTADDSTATITLTSGLVVATATVTATAKAGAANTTVEFAVDNTTARVLAIIATPANIPANGSAQSVLTATIGDGYGNPVGPGVPVSWTTTGGTLSSLVSTTDANSKVTINLTSPLAVGSAQVTATAVAGSANAVVTFSSDAGTARVVGLVATPTIIPANGAAVSTLVATVLDANGNAVGPNVPVTWSSNTGSLSSASSVTDAAGKATVTLSGTVAGTATVKAEAVAGFKTANVLLSPDASTAKVVNLVATPTTILANGAAVSTLVATVTDASGNSVGANVPVTWSSNIGSLSSASTLTDATGKATVTLRSTMAGIATVKAQAIAGFKTADVTTIADISTAKPQSIVATPTSIKANGTDFSTIVATVTDANNNPLGAGIAVTWTTNWGNLSSTSTLTDSLGRATVTLSGPWSGPATITASVGSTTLMVGVNMVADVNTARVVSLTPTPGGITANGVDYSTIVGVVKDGNDNLVGAGQVVRWSTNFGDFSEAQSITDANSQVTVQFRCSTTGVAYPQGATNYGYRSTNVFCN